MLTTLVSTRNLSPASEPGDRPPIFGEHDELMFDGGRKRVTTSTCRGVQTWRTGTQMYGEIGDDEIVMMRTGAE